MIALALTTLLTVVLFICFKEFSKRAIDTHQAITFNYLTASILGILLYDNIISINEIITTDWIYPTITLGVFFVIMFNVMAITTQKLGISIASMASKISLIIPVSTALLFQKNIDLSFVNGLGIAIALIAIYLSFKINNLKDTVTLRQIIEFAYNFYSFIIKMWHICFKTYQPDRCFKFF